MVWPHQLGSQDGPLEHPQHKARGEADEGGGEKHNWLKYGGRRSLVKEKVWEGEREVEREEPTAANGG
ncbi:hypothetical protein V6N13_057011 [Hibiscus sabdariffa]|uniref:Uncharacterized protein n=1 Tax=Hibiscus sabdariffa TaxID=183260 RepID=A0ABR2D2Q0_9ROSI